ncbi:hypothetical protein ANCCAN_16139 [Ancylostoma caninum]|uniref:Uncharacterized protein n=1 Tax=Ancylostoma caninum TaxID=29170 RepID=A0A368G0G3_ANCCA|nr:hypothetical protein ANCCAN_16139 [Ancylostoma caninum]
MHKTFSFVVTLHHLGTNIEHGGDQRRREWIDFLLKVGNGTVNDDDGGVTLPHENVCVDNIVSVVYRKTVDAGDTDNPSIRAILAPRNRSVDQLSVEVLSWVNSEEKECKSIDEAGSIRCH